MFRQAGAVEGEAAAASGRTPRLGLQKPATRYQPRWSRAQRPPTQIMPARWDLPDAAHPDKLAAIRVPLPVSRDPDGARRRTPACGSLGDRRRRLLRCIDSWPLVSGGVRFHGVVRHTIVCPRLGLDDAALRGSSLGGIGSRSTAGPSSGGARTCPGGGGGRCRTRLPRRRRPRHDCPQDQKTHATRNGLDANISVTPFWRESRNSAILSLTDSMSKQIECRHEVRSDRLATRRFKLVQWLVDSDYARSTWRRTATPCTPGARTLAPGRSRFRVELGSGEGR